MLREQAKLFNRCSKVVDLVVITSAFFLSYYMFKYFYGNVGPLRDYLWVLIPVVPVWFYQMQKYGLYESIRRLSLSDIFIRLFNIHFWGGIILASLIYLYHGYHLSRLFYLIFLGTSLGFFLIDKIILRRGLGIIRKRGKNSRNVLIVGSGKTAREFHDILEDHSDWGITVLGFVSDHMIELEETIDGHPFVGQVDDLLDICKANPVDEVVFCLSKGFVDKAEGYFHVLEELGITVRVVVDFFDMNHSKREIGFFHDKIPIITFHTRSLDAQQLLFKRILDVVGGTIGVLALGVMFPFLALAIKLESPGPIFFGQKRVGENGRIFTCWKFRSMYIDAEERKKELMTQNEMSGAIFKIKNDPRITRVGRILRKTSLDEFPQFWNVLKGEMSLVGTRPPTPQEVNEYENWHRRRISIRPGITGMWQVSGRNQINDFDEIVRLDLHYIDSWNVWLDLKILFKTVKAVFAGSGSC